MIFHWPHLLWLLVPVIALAVWDAVRRGQGGSARDWPKILRAWAGARQATVGNGRHTTRGRLLLWLGLAFGVVALARPQWGRVDEPVFDQSREIVIALDLSRSMQATDVRPSRLERARLLIQGLLGGLHGERVGLVVFAGTAFLQVPMSADYEVLNEFLPSLNPAFMPVGGTNYTAMLHAVLDAFSASSSADRYLIVLSDGESLDDDWRGLVDDLRRKNIRVIGLGVGTPEGSFIPDGAGGYVKDERGAVVLSKLNSTTLQELARATDGVYTDASTWVDLGALLKRTVETGKRGEFKEAREVRQLERFQWALAPALLCLLFSLWREFPVRPRARSLPLSAPQAPKSQSPGPKSQTVTAAALVVLAVLAGSRFPASGFAAEDTSAYAAPLGKLVERLAGQPGLLAGDYAALAQETLTWGRRLQDAKQPVLPGPVRDALLCVDLGEKLDAKAADWPQLRHDLEELLKKPPEPPPQPNQQQQQQDKQQQQPQQKSGGGQQQQNQQQQQQQSQSQNPESQPQGQQPPPPPANNSERPNTGDTQKVGGQPPPQEDRGNPSLALPIQKLDQLRNEDSPAELFRLLDSRQQNAPPKKGRDW